jgi:hypothetical protein
MVSIWAQGLSKADQALLGDFGLAAILLELAALLLGLCFGVLLVGIDEGRCSPRFVARAFYRSQGNPQRGPPGQILSWFSLQL